MKKTKNFQFKQFNIEGGYSGMPVSTDGVLLGAWANLSQCSCLLDIGTGTGLLSLMAAQRYPSIEVDAIDIDQHAISAAKQNFADSPWGPRLKLLSGDVLSHCFNQTYSAIICNPPYFTSGEQAKNQARATARHTDTLTHPALLSTCWRLLNHDGKANFILPAAEGGQFIQLALKMGWHLSRYCQVKPSEVKPVNRLLIELSKQPSPVQNETLQIASSQGYSAEFVQLTKAFYLKM
ncbi:methyltransferase [Vibrio sp. JPW-9-11-11]|uniref:tRNA1(Val) (adenine(37)-N6)-methyltransferase n=1 Tax=Vibrio sp. JPW-9-11-11 TaxID=1416532 RepID=UPI0015941640|nr:methyltransferase [Vibrio sp. JPW-9-11-11]NVD05752.1 methyltransferase [Vibrio sp. JPW-9-11-11]